MKLKTVSILLLSTCPKEANLIKQVVQRNAETALFLTAFNIKEFEKKLNWFPTTFIILMQHNQITGCALKIIKNYKPHAPLIMVSATREELSHLPNRLEIIYKETEHIRNSLEVERLKKVKHFKYAEFNKS